MGDEPLELEVIHGWKMSEPEAEAYQIAVTYEQCFRKIFGSDSDHSFKENSLARRTDPRKCNLFRQCWKMRRQTRGLIEFSEYKNYIHANMTIIKMHNGKILPNCICGDKAWVRYKVWKRKFDAKMAEIAGVAPPPSVNTTSPKIVIEIDRTKKFLFERCDGEVTWAKIETFIRGGMYRLWMASGKISPYYVAMSPFVARSGELEKTFAVATSSLASVREKITKEVTDYFRHEYAHEFG